MGRGNIHLKGTPARYIIPDDIREKLFWAKAELQGECIVWTGYIDLNGYGVTTYHQKFMRTHRLAFLFTHGTFYGEPQLDHLCNNRACMNPEHLEPVTNAENAYRAGQRQTHCIHGHERTVENIRLDSKGNKFCRICQRLCIKNFEEKKRRARGARINAHLTADNVLEARKLYKSGIPCRRLSRQYGVGNTTMRHVLLGDTWKHLLTEEV